MDDMYVSLREPYYGIHGKISRVDDIVFRVRKGHQEVYILRPRSGSLTYKQQLMVCQFSLASQMVKRTLAYARSYWEKEYHRVGRKKFKTFRGFVMSTVYHTISSVQVQLEWHRRYDHSSLLYNPPVPRVKRVYPYEQGVHTFEQMYEVYGDVVLKL